MALSRAGVIGAGIMGMGIAQWLAFSGFGVTLCSRRPEARKAFIGSVNRFYQRRVKRGAITEEGRDELFASIRTTDGYEGFEDVDIIFESVAEEMEAKIACFKALDSICPEQTIFSSNTSSLSISAMAGVTERPDRFLGIHFFQPARFMKVIEVVQTEKTSPQTREFSLEFCCAGGKDPILVKDRPGFLVNRLLGVYLLEAVRLMEEEGVDPLRIDRTMMNQGMLAGPCRMADLIGLDLLLVINQVLRALDPVKFKLSPVHEALVASGDLGQKTGRGIYIYRKSGEPDRLNDSLACRLEGGGKEVLNEELLDRILLALLNEAWLCVEGGVAKAGDIDHALQEIMGMPKGPISLTKEMGTSMLTKRLEALAFDHGERYRPAAILETMER